jgi:hydrogen peroxide-dependent heme synthase
MRMADNGGMTGKPSARELNELIRYTMWSVFRVQGPGALDAAGRDTSGGRDGLAAEVSELCRQASGKGVVTRGCYDVQGLRADADYMFWWIAPSPDDLQETYARFRRTGLGRVSEPVWSVMALHRPAEFNKSHLPAFLADEEPRAYVSVYPFVRSYEWYLLEDPERRSMLAEHGIMAREYPDVRANTVACFALNDYEWMLAFEADELHRIVDLMRHLRGADARRHTRVEIPFFTGRRKPPAELVADLA